MTDPKATFDVTAAVGKDRVRLTGEVSDRAYHDKLIDLFVAMKLYPAAND